MKNFFKKISCKRKFIEHIFFDFNFQHKNSKISDDEYIEEEMLRDIKDKPVLRAAIESGADILITGDKDFLESGIEHPQILTSTKFLTL